MMPSESLTIEGVLLARDTPGYEEARTSNFAGNSHSRDIASPAYIAVVKTIEDIQKCIAFCSKHKLTVTVRTGGHNWFGCFLRKDGFLIDMKNFDSMELDTESKTATVGPAVSGADLNEEAAKHGLCFTTGHVAGVPLGGFLLGGGVGWFYPYYGYAAEYIEEITLVDPAGNVVVASDKEMQDWMWLARGSGSMFPGVVVSFKLKLLPLPPILRSKTDMYPVQDYKKMLDHWYGCMMTDPDSLSKMEYVLMLGSTPPPLADVVKSPKVLMLVTVIIADSEDEFTKLYETVSNPPSAPLLPGKFEDSTFKGLAESMAGAYPPGQNWIPRALFHDADHLNDINWTDVTNAFIDKAPLGMSHLAFASSPKRKVTSPGCYGPLSSAGFCLLIFGVYGPNDDGIMERDFVESTMQVVDPFVWKYDHLEFPLNKNTFRKSFPDTAERLLQLRAKFDPESVFFDPSKAEPSH